MMAIQRLRSGIFSLSSPRSTHSPFLNFKDLPKKKDGRPRRATDSRIRASSAKYSSSTSGAAGGDATVVISSCFFSCCSRCCCSLNASYVRLMGELLFTSVCRLNFNLAPPRRAACSGSFLSVSRPLRRRCCPEWVDQHAACGHGLSELGVGEPKLALAGEPSA